MVRMVVALACIVVLLTGMVLGAGCAAGGGDLASLKIGSKWSHQLAQGGAYYEVSTEVTDATLVGGKECWVVTMSFDPTYMGTESATGRVDKSNGELIQFQAPTEFMGMDCMLSVNYSHYWQDGSSSLQEVGEQATMVTKKTETADCEGETYTETETMTFTCKVEEVEEITVPAGTYTCFKIASYNETGEKVSVEWHSDEVLPAVKTVDYENEIELVTRELKSYSV